MVIRKIEIGNFGKLKNYYLELEEGVQFFYGNNEDGKSTILAFIKMIFYKETTRSKEVLLNERKKYMPWDGALMYGALEFEFDNLTYRLEKEWGITPGKDKIILRNLFSGDLVSLGKEEDPGYYFFKMGLSGFEKTFFAGRSGSFSIDKKDEIMDRLMNMITGNEGDTSFVLVMSRVSKALEELRSLNGKKGTLISLEEKMDDLLNKLQSSRQEELRERALEEKYEKLTGYIQYKREEKGLIVKRQEEKEWENSKKVYLRVLEKGQELEEILQKVFSKINTQEEEEIETWRGKVDEFFEVWESRIEWKVRRAEREDSGLEIQLQSIEQKIIPYIRSRDSYKDLEERVKNLEDSADLKWKAMKQLEQIEERESDLKKNREFRKNTIIGVLALGIGIFLLLLNIIGILKISMYFPIFLWVLGGLFIYIPERISSRKRRARREELLKAKGFWNQELEKAQKDSEVFSELLPVLENLEEDSRSLLETISKSDWESLGFSPQHTTLEELLEKRTLLMSKMQDSEVMEMKKPEVLETDFLEMVNRVMSVGSIADAAEKYREFRRLWGEVLSLKAEIRGLLLGRGESKEIQSILDITNALEQVRGILATYEASVNFKQLEGNLTQLPQIGVGNENTIEEIEIEIEKAEEERLELRGKMNAIMISSTDIEREIARYQVEYQEMFQYYEDLKETKRLLEKSIEEIRNTFSPELNQRTGEILSELTGGRYTKLIISKNFDLSIQEADSLFYKEWGYLSSGTIDQAYLALRLALTQFFNPMTQEIMPLLLDDIFSQYDKTRVQRGFLYLENAYRQERYSQILFFTCQEYFIEQYREITGKIPVIKKI